jgi:hypothetical protein
MGAFYNAKVFMTLFVVFSGTCDERQVVSIFSTRELAEAYKAQYVIVKERDGSTEIEEWTLDEDAGKIATTVYKAILYEKHPKNHQYQTHLGLEVPGSNDCDIRSWNGQYGWAVVATSAVSFDHAQKAAEARLKQLSDQK